MTHVVLPGVSDELKDRIKAAVDRRNFLIHDYWGEAGYTSATKEGRAEMIAELVADIDTFEQLAADLREATKPTRRSSGSRTKCWTNELNSAWPTSEAVLNWSEELIYASMAERRLSDAHIRLPQPYPLLPGQPRQPFDRRVQQLAHTPAGGSRMRTDHARDQGARGQTGRARVCGGEHLAPAQHLESRNGSACRMPKRPSPRRHLRSRAALAWARNRMRSRLGRRNGPPRRGAGS